MTNRQLGRIAFVPWADFKVRYFILFTTAYDLKIIFTLLVAMCAFYCSCLLRCFETFAEFVFIPARVKGGRYLMVLEGARHGKKD